MQKWFLLGVLIAFVAVFLAQLLGLQLAGTSQADANLLVFLVIMIWCIVTRPLSHLPNITFGREPPPHTLFTPLYDQR